VAGEYKKSHPDPTFSYIFTRFPRIPIPIFRLFVTWPDYRLIVSNICPKREIEYFAVPSASTTHATINRAKGDNTSGQAIQYCMTLARIAFETLARMSGPTTGSKTPNFPTHPFCAQPTVSSILNMIAPCSDLALISAQYPDMIWYAQKTWANCEH
jgi:hypothetical protein